MRWLKCRCLDWEGRGGNRGMFGVEVWRKMWCMECGGEKGVWIRGGVWM